MVASASHGDYSEKEHLAFDTDNSGAVTDTLYINGNRTVGVYVHADTGANTTHVITMEVSANGTDFFTTNPTVTITGLGYEEFDTIAQHVRGKVTTPEGGTSTVNVTLTSK